MRVDNDHLHIELKYNIAKVHCDWSIIPSGSHFVTERKPADTIIIEEPLTNAKTPKG